MRLLAAAGLAGACLATSPLFAADLFSSAPPPMDAAPYQTELGSNWYIRGDVGVGVTNEATVVPEDGLLQTVRQGGYTDPTNNWVNTVKFNSAPTGAPFTNDAVTRGNNQSSWSPDFTVGFGYRVNDWLRVEGTYQFFKGPGLATQAQEQCPGVMGAVNNYSYAGPADMAGVAGPALGYGYTASTCNGYLNTTQYNNVGMANAYVDLGHFGMINPFIGAGLGVNANSISGSLNYADATTGAAYAGPLYVGSAPTVIEQATYTDQAGRPVYAPLTDKNGNTPQDLFKQQSWDRSFSATRFTIAGQLMAGVGVPISQSATLDLAYKVMSLDLSGGMNNLRQSVSLGVRYNLN